MLTVLIVMLAIAAFMPSPIYDANVQMLTGNLPADLAANATAAELQAFRDYSVNTYWMPGLLFVLIGMIPLMLLYRKYPRAFYYDVLYLAARIEKELAQK